MQFDSSLVFDATLWFVAFVFSTTLHEAAHAWAALRMGDETAYLGGQVTLNPAPHILREPFGMVLVPIVSFFLMGGSWMIGWASAPYDPMWAQRYPKRSAKMALAGPVANLLLVFASGLAIKLGVAAGAFEPGPMRRLQEMVAGTEPGVMGTLATILSIVFVLNLVLFLFNLLPIPPMDGSGVVQMFMSDDVARRYQQFLYQPMWGLVGLLLAWRVFPAIFSPLFAFSYRLLFS